MALPTGIFKSFNRSKKGGSTKGTDKLYKSTGQSNEFGFLMSYLLGYGGTGAAVRKAIEEFLPKFSNKVMVAITGSPRSNMNDIYFLALSTAFGTMKQFAYLSDNNIKTTIDRSNKRVVVELTYVTGAIASSANFLGSAAFDNGKDVIQAGVPASIQGADWPNFLKNNLTANKELPLVGQTIATHEPAVNYLPYNDAKSRDNDLTQIIAAALLMGPCTKPGQTFTNNLGSPVRPVGQVAVDAIKALPNPTNSPAPSQGGVDTNRWLLLGQKGINETVPASVSVPPYRTSQTSSLSGG